MNGVIGKRAKTVAAIMAVSYRSGGGIVAPGNVCFARTDGSLALASVTCISVSIIGEGRAPLRSTDIFTV